MSEETARPEDAETTLEERGPANGAATIDGAASIDEAEAEVQADAPIAIGGIATEVEAEAPIAIDGIATEVEAEAPIAIDESPLGLDEASLEGLLFVAEKPLSRREIAALAGVSREEVDARLGDLEVSLRSRGLRLVVAGDRVELATAPSAGRLIARYLGVDALRLSPAALETLAIVAYRQPVTKAAVERIRGVDSDYSLRALLHRRLIVEMGRSEAPGRPILYGTGFEFLERFGLTSLDELPVLDSLVDERLTDQDDDVRSISDGQAPGTEAGDPKIVTSQPGGA